MYPYKISKAPKAHSEKEVLTETGSLDEIFDALMNENEPAHAGKTKSWYKSAAPIAAMLLVSYLTYSAVTRLANPASGTSAAAPRVGRVMRNTISAAMTQPVQSFATLSNFPSLTLTPTMIMVQYLPG